jgi:methionyl-tRNA formyltransferase
MMAIRSVFLGSPEFAVPSLTALAGITEVVGVVTQPDRPAGRGRAQTAPPIKIQAELLHLPVIQPEKLRAPEAFAQLRDWRPEVIVVTAYGQILRPDVLRLPRYGCLNLHASLLPRHRGAAPIAAALLAGDAETGITLMQMDPGLDTGPMLARRAIPIQQTDTAGSLAARLADLAAETLTEFLPVYIRGELAPAPQDPALATYAPLLKKEDGRLDVQQDAVRLERQIRAYTPWPGAFLIWKQTVLKILAGEAGEATGRMPAGTFTIHQGFPAVHCGQGLLILRTVQPSGKRPMSGAEFLRGARGFITSGAALHE